MKNLKILQITVILILSIAVSNAQDQIVTRKGKVIKGRVKKISYDEIMYKKYFFQIQPFKIKTHKVLYVVNEDGKKTIINDVTMAKRYKNYAKGAVKPPHIIERLGNKYRIDTNRIIGYGRLNDLLEQSSNPIVKTNLKAAKTMRTITIITKITSYPSTVGGAFASYKTLTKLYDMRKAGTAGFTEYLNAGLSAFGTISVPITGAILKSIQRKLYDKTLVVYSMGN